MERLILLPVMAVCITRTVSYGVYTVKDRNKLGAVGLFMLSAAAAGAVVWAFMG